MHNDAALAQQWVAQWRRGGVALDRVRATELARLSDADALAAAETLLDIGASLPLPVDRVTWSGLIDCQQLFHRRR
jgi:hypothetical protein